MSTPLLEAFKMYQDYQSNQEASENNQKQSALLNSIMYQVTPQNPDTPQMTNAQGVDMQVQPATPVDPAQQSIDAKRQYADRLSEASRQFTAINPEYSKKLQSQALELHKYLDDHDKQDLANQAEVTKHIGSWANTVTDQASLDIAKQQVNGRHGNLWDDMKLPSIYNAQTAPLFKQIGMASMNAVQQMDMQKEGVDLQSRQQQNDANLTHTKQQIAESQARIAHMREIGSREDRQAASLQAKEDAARIKAEAAMEKAYTDEQAAYENSKAALGVNPQLGKLSNKGKEASSGVPLTGLLTGGDNIGAHPEVPSPRSVAEAAQRARLDEAHTKKVQSLDDRAAAMGYTKKVSGGTHNGNPVVGTSNGKPVYQKPDGTRYTIN